MSQQKIAERIKVIDVDTHIVEPVDLWTSRMSEKWGSAVPHVETAVGPVPGHSSIRAGDDFWVMNGRSPITDPLPADTEQKMAFSVGAYPSLGGFGMAGFAKHLPDHPRNHSEMLPAAYDPAARLRLMDEYGIYAQVCYPNVGAFGGGFSALENHELKLACVRAYNDYMREFSSENPNRFISLVSTPFWDLDATIAEIKRCAAFGAKGILFTWSPEAYGMPYIADPFWNPLWQLCSDLEFPINFHIGAGSFENPKKDYPGNGYQVNYVKYVTCASFSLAPGVAELIGSGIGLRYPKLKFVFVESGVGWIPFVLEMMTWMWGNSGVYDERPELRAVTPLELFQRNIFGTFWFEDRSVKAAIEALGPDNIMFETDFPHPTCVAPGPNSSAKNPIEHIEDRFANGDIPEAHLRKILFENAARLYHVD